MKAITIPLHADQLVPQSALVPKPAAGEVEIDPTSDPDVLVMLRRHARYIGPTDAHLTIANEYLQQLRTQVGECNKHYVVQRRLRKTDSVCTVLRQLIADRMLLVHTLLGAEAAAVVAVAEMRGLQSDANNIVAWTTLGLLALACRGPRGVEVPGPAEFGHGTMTMHRKVGAQVQQQLMLTFVSASDAGTNSHAGAHFVLDEVLQELVVSVDPALRIGDGNTIPSVPAARMFAGARMAVEALAASQALFSAIGARNDGVMFLVHLCAPDAATARRAVQMYANTRRFELFAGHLNSLGNLKPTVLPPIRMMAQPLAGNEQAE